MSFEDQCRVQGQSEPLYSSYEFQTCEESTETPPSNTVTDKYLNPAPEATQDNDFLSKSLAWLGKIPGEDFRDFLHRKTGIYYYKFGEGIVPEGKYARAALVAKMVEADPTITHVNR